MADTLYLLTDRQVSLLQELLDEHRGRIRNTVGRPHVPREDYGAPDVYIARVPSGGIPALSPVAGTSLADEPGSALCDIYRVLELSPAYTGTGSLANRQWYLVKVPTNQRRVFNLTTSSVSGDQWIIVERDKFGAWLVPGGGGSSTGFWADITHKSYSSGVPVYSWTRLDPSAAGSLSTDAESGGPGASPAYEVNNVDLPVSGDGVSSPGTGTGSCLWPTTFGTLKLVVWLRKGSGDFYFFGVPPRWEILYKSGDLCPDGYYPGVLMRYDQGTKALVQVEQVRLINFNA